MKKHATSVLALLAGASLSSCLSSEDMGSNSKAPSDPGCEAGTRFGADELECGKSEADIDLSVQTPSGTAVLRGEPTLIEATRFGTSRTMDIKIRNLGQSPATALTLNLGTQQDESVFAVGSSGSDLPAAPCGATLAPGAECTIRLVFSPWGKPYERKTWKNTLTLEYQNGREARLLEFPIEGNGEFCASQEVGLTSPHNPRKTAARLESDSVQLTQSFVLPSRSETSSEAILNPALSELRIPIAKSSQKTRFSFLHLSVHASDPTQPSRPIGAALASTSLPFVDLQAAWESPGTDIEWTESETGQGVLATPRELVFRFADPVTLPTEVPLVWVLGAHDLTGGHLLVSRHENLDGKDEAYGDGAAGLLSAQGTRFTAHPYFDINFSFAACLGPQ
jgi:hypothetical protein